MELFFQQLVSGMASGSLYSLLAVGIVLILKTTGVANFAQGEMGMFGTFIAFTLITVFQVNIYLSIVISIAVAGGIGLLVYKLILSKLKDAPALNTVIVTLGLYFCFHSLAGIIWGHNTYNFPQLFSDSTISFAGIAISKQNLGIIITTLSIALLFSLFFKKTKIGIATLAVAQNRYAAKLMGINIEFIYLVTWTIGIMLAVFAGTMLAPVIYLDENMMGALLIKSFAGAVLGGLASVSGAFFGGLLLGVVENQITTFFSGELKDTFSFLIILLVLFLKPEGIFGNPYREKV